MPSGLPPRMMSVPRPAMLVAMVTDALAARLGHDLRLPLVVLGVQHHVGDAGGLQGVARSSLLSMLAVPTRMGWPLVCSSLISSTMAFFFPARVE